MSKALSYKDHLLKELKNPKEAAAYLNACLEDEDPRTFLLALRDVAESFGGMGNLADKTDLNRESLYRTLSLRGNPRYTSLRSVLGAFGLGITIKPRQRSTIRRKKKLYVNLYYSSGLRELRLVI